MGVRLLPLLTPVLFPCSPGSRPTSANSQAFPLRTLAALPHLFSVVRFVTPPAHASRAFPRALV